VAQSIHEWIKKKGAKLAQRDQIYKLSLIRIFSIYCEWKTGIDPETESSGMENEEKEEKQFNLYVATLPENLDRTECCLSAWSNGREEDVIFKRRWVARTNVKCRRKERKNQ